MTTDNAGTIIAQIRLALKQMEKDGLNAQKAIDNFTRKFNQQWQTAGKGLSEGIKQVFDQIEASAEKLGKSIADKLSPAVSSIESGVKMFQELEQTIGDVSMLNEKFANGLSELKTTLETKFYEGVKQLFEQIEADAGKLGKSIADKLSPAVSSIESGIKIFHELEQAIGDTSVLNEKFAKGLSELKATLEASFNEGINQLFEQVEAGAERLGKSIADKLSPAISSIESGIKIFYELGKTIGDASVLNEKFAKGLSGLKATLEANLTEEINQIFDQVEAGAERLGKSIADKLSPAISSIESGIKMFRELEQAIGEVFASNGKLADSLSTLKTSMEASFSEGINQIFEQVEAGVDQLGKSITDKLSPVVSSIKTGIEMFKEIEQTIGEVFAPNGKFANALSGLKTTLETNFTEGIKKIFDQVEAGADQLGKSITDKLSSAVSSIKSGIEIFKGLGKEIEEVFAPNGKFANAISGLKTVLETNFTEGIKKIFDQIEAGAVQLGKSIVDRLSPAISSIKSGIEIFQGLGRAIGDVSTLNEKFANGLSTLKTTLETNFAEGVKQVFEQVETAVEGLGKSIVDRLSPVISSIKPVIEIFQGLGKIIGDAFLSNEKFANGLSVLKTVLGSNFTAAVKPVSDFFTGLIDKAKGSITQTKEVEDVSKTVKDSLIKDNASIVSDLKEKASNVQSITEGMKKDINEQSQEGNFFENMFSSETYSNMLQNGEAAIAAFDQISSAALEISRKHAEKQIEIIERALESTLADIQKAREEELLAAGFAVESNIENMEAWLEAEKYSGEEALAYQLERRALEQEINEKYDAQVKAAQEKAAQEKGKIEYDLAMQEYAINMISAANAGVMAVLQALGSAPPPANFILAGLAGGAAAIQIGMLASNPPQPPKFAAGGIVPGDKYTGDRVHALVNSGELILNRAHQDNIASQLTENSGEVRATIVVMMDTREIAESTVNLVNDGFYTIKARAVK